MNIPTFFSYLVYPVGQDQFPSGPIHLPDDNKPRFPWVSGYLERR